MPAPFLDSPADCPDFLETLLATVPHAVFITSGDGYILRTNPRVREIFGHAEENLLEKQLAMLFTPEDMNLLYPNLLYLALTEQAVSEEVMLMRRNGTRFMALVHIRLHSRGDKSLLIVVIEDIDQAKQLKKLFQTMGYDDLLKVTNGMGHEIRNPLMIIGGYLRKIYTSCKSTDEDDAYYQCIVENLKKIENIIRKLEFFTTPPKPSFFPSPISLVVEWGVKPYAQTIQARNIQCSVDAVPRELPLDQKMMTRAVSILVENALDAMPEGGELRITGREEDQWYMISVQDSGPGIPREELRQIFHPFFSTRPHSAGIDLAILKRIMDSHNGRIEVFSRSGEGARFDLFLPLERRRAIRRVALHPQSMP